MEPRVQRLLKDARASVSHPMRPETPKEAPRPGMGRARLTSLRSPVTEGESYASATELALSANTGTPADVWGQRLQRATTLPEQMTLITSMIHELRVIRPSEEEACVALVHQLVKLSDERCSSDDDDVVMLSIRAASAACKIAMNGASPSFSEALVGSTLLLQLHAKQGRGAALKAEMIFDSLIQLLRMQSSGWCRDAISNALATLRHCSSEGGPILVHLATLGLLSATSQLATRVLPTKDAELLCHCAAIFRNFSADYPQHFVRLQCTPVMIQVLDLGTQMRLRGGSASRNTSQDGDAWRDIVGAIARGLAKLVFDEDCIAVLSTFETATSIMTGLSAFGTSKMIVARLGTAMEMILHRFDDEILDRFVETNEGPIKKFALALSSSSTITSTDNVSGLADEAVQCSWRLIGTLSLCAKGGVMLVACFVETLLTWLDARLDTDNGSTTFILALMCLSNFSFYLSTALGEEKTGDLLRDYGGLLVQLLFRADTEALLEATRTFGNLSRSNSGRQWIEDNRCDEVCIVLSQHKDLRIVFNSFGILLNLSAADHCRIVEDGALCAQVLEQTGKYHLLDLSEDEDSEEAQVSMVVEKLLCNLSSLV
ncbi:Hypothetical protein, putative [Bodo saltans]|uniref:Wings apart-like protein C-terminal domain-containing protein n=1 Tax=Bodo saltans TaxID=75058 RepID=A0A0S4IMN9_BODSA|nr:Hypothetical protein, putative [Bodo saltans]|eukprot:CUE73263.1 Hypothetical protein, putative [Bodo saltans]